MKVAAFILLSACGSAFGQDEASNPAAKAAAQRLRTLTLFPPPRLAVNQKLAARLPSGVCSVPLTPAPLPPAASGKMHVLKPPPSQEPSVHEPAPACLSQNPPSQNK